MRDRRAGFFLVAAVLAGALTPIADASHRWVPIVTSITYVVLALASALDHRSRERVQPRAPRRR